MKKLGLGGRAGISSKFYKCGRSEGKGNEAMEGAAIIKVFHHGW